MAPRRLIVPRDAPARLDLFLIKALPGFSKAQIQRLLSEGRVRVNGKKAKPLRRIVGNEEVELDLPDAKPPAPPATKVDGPQLRALYEDRNILIVDKPSGWVVEREANRASVVALAAQQFSGFSVGGLADPGVVHRLDKDTTGCLMFAKTDESLVALKLAFEEKRVEKTYVALVLGEPTSTGNLDTPYGRNPEDPRRYTSRVSSARRARLSWKTVSQQAGYALLEINLDTGRTHQIRAQLSDIGHPLLGDWLYGTAEARSMGFGRIALHAIRLAVAGVHATEVRVEAPLPEDFATFIGRTSESDGRRHSPS